MKSDSNLALNSGIAHANRPTASMVAICVLFIIAGTAHFVWSAAEMSVIPSWVPQKPFVNVFVGVCEYAGAVGVLVPKLRQPAAIGLLALLACVFPANVGMAIHQHTADLHAVLLWGRLPLQPLLMYWIYAVCFQRRRRE